ncbi:RES domain-containing protein [Bacillus safensis]|uniref:RES domain-containing protein n=1 Tax=Bacillus safensis TaxID=561879 RepID=UPI0016424D8A|nr:RES domain-containing protein [Bacillus safensis]
MGLELTLPVVEVFLNLKTEVGKMQEVICLNCFNVDEQMEALNIEVDVLNESPPIYIVGYAEEGEYYCTKCEEELLPTECYVIDEGSKEVLMGIVAEKAGEILSEKIEYCSYCSEGQEIEYTSYKYEKEEVNFLHIGEHVYDFLSENGVFEEYFDLILDNLICPNCNYGTGYDPKNDPDNGSFESLDKIYTREEINSFWGFDEDSFSEIAKKYEINIESSKLKEFEDYLFEKPLLAYKHEIGKKIYRTLENIYSQEDYFILERGLELFRGRNRGKDKKKHSQETMWNPPKGDTSHGRYNPVGISVLYCTNDMKGIPYEIEPKKNEVTDVATFNNCRKLYLLDIDRIFTGFEGFLSAENQESTNVRKGYLITNFIAICCIEIGFDGIKYEGASDLGYYNFAFFNPNDFTFNVKGEIDSINFKSNYDIS